MVINYLSGSAKDITYTPSGKSVSLRASDFTEAYRQAVGSTAPSGLTIQFRSCCWAGVRRHSTGCRRRAG